MIDEDHLKLSQIIILQLREETLPWRVTQGNYFYLFLNYSECKKTYSNSCEIVDIEEFSNENPCKPYIVL